MGTRDIANEEHTYDEVLEMSETAPPVNVRNKSNPYRGPANVKNTHDLYDDLRIPQLNGFKRSATRWLKGVAVVTVVNTVVLIAVIIFLGIRVGTEKNGGWSVWSVWTLCSATCDTGVQTRQRQCNNPIPSSGGEYCEGSPMDVVHCNKQHCPRIREGTETDGGCSTWNAWTSCTVTCNSGLKTRQRQCANPRPSGGGQYCDGTPIEVEPCNQNPCPRANSSFTATSAAGLSSGDLSFSGVLLNEGSNFDGGSGTFTCQHSGLYFFAASVIEGGGGANTVYCTIRRNKFDIIVGFRYRIGKDSTNTITHDGYGAATGSATLHLTNGDRVNIWCEPYTSTVTYSSFTGYLIAKDP